MTTKPATGRFNVRRTDRFGDDDWVCGPFATQAEAESAKRDCDKTSVAVDDPDDQIRYYVDEDRPVSVIQRAVSEAAAILGRKGGKVKSERKTKAARKNAKRPRPRKHANTEEDSC
jgi:hypothetical protein